MEDLELRDEPGNPNSEAKNLEGLNDDAVPQPGREVEGIAGNSYYAGLEWHHERCHGVSYLVRQLLQRQMLSQPKLDSKEAGVHRAGSGQSHR